MSIQPTPAQVHAACAAARSVMNAYSQWESNMVPDTALQSVVTAALVAAFNVPHPQTALKGSKS